MYLDTVEGIIRHFDGEDGIPLLVQYIPGVQYPVLITNIYTRYQHIRNTKRNVLLTFTEPPLFVQRVKRYYHRARLFGSWLDCSLGQRVCASTFMLLVGYGQDNSV
jgi:hypothetical protein